LQMEEEQASKTLGQLQTAGVALIGLEVAERRSGLGGRTLLTLAIASVRGGGLLPPHRLHAGDLVALRPSGSKGAVAGAVAGAGDTSETRGTVYRVYEAQIVVAMEDDQVRIRLMAPPQVAGERQRSWSERTVWCPVPSAPCLWLSAGICTRRKSCRQARCAW
jgi:hypothetical protein